MKLSKIIAFIISVLIVFGPAFVALWSISSDGSSRWRPSPEEVAEEMDLVKRAGIDQEIFLFYIMTASDDSTIRNIDRILHSDASEGWFDASVEERVAASMSTREIPYFNYLMTGIILWNRWVRMEGIDLEALIRQAEATSDELEFPLDDVVDEPMNPILGDE